MKFVEGTSLAGHPRGESAREVAGLVDVVRAVHHAHQRGVLHRDLKPSNVLVDSQGTRLVTDFGLAKRLADGDGSFTETGQVLGTPKYMAPEQAAGRKDLTVAADVYSLGVILYERLTGQTPFTGDNALTLLRQARESEPPRPSTIRPGLDRDLETVVLKCLEKEPGRRYPSAEALADDLDRWFERRADHGPARGPSRAAWRWCRRNPVVSGIDGGRGRIPHHGDRRLDVLRVQERRETEPGRECGAEGGQCSRQDGGLLARGLAKPLDPSGVDKQVLSLPEAETLWELARLGDTRYRPPLPGRSHAGPVQFRPARARSEPAMIAAVGLDTEKRKNARLNS